MISTARWSGRPAVAGALGHRAHVELEGAAPRWPRPLLVMPAATALTAAALSVLAPVDQRQISGADRWLKPWKFSVSITVYVLTLGLLTVSATAGLATAAGIGVTVVLRSGASPSARGPTTDGVRRLEAPARTDDAALAPRP